MSLILPFLSQLLPIYIVLGWLSARSYSASIAIQW
jgi:hypothetical protein